MKPDDELLAEWRLIVRDSLMYVMKGNADTADEAVVAIDEYVSWLEHEMEKLK